MKKTISVFFVLFILFFANVYAHDIEDFSNSEWFDNITLDYIIKYQTPYLSKYDIINFSFPKINNSSDYNDWGFYSISGLGGVGAIYSVTKEDDDKIVFEYGYYPNSLDSNEKPIKESNPNICTIYILDENTISLLNPPLTHLQRVTLYRKSFKKNSDKDQKGFVNNLDGKIRLSPKSNDFILGKLQTGTNVKVIKKYESSNISEKDIYWYQIQVEGYPICWILGEYITLMDDWVKQYQEMY